MQPSKRSIRERRVNQLEGDAKGIAMRHTALLLVHPERV